MTLVLHIGGSKAGSTSVQGALCRHQQFLRRKGISIINKKVKASDGGRVRIGFRSLFYAVHGGGCPRGDRARFSAKEEYRKYQKSQAVALKSFLATQARKSRHIIISDEYLLGLDYATVNGLAEFLRISGYDDVHVIVYFREPASLYVSLTQQRLKADYRIPDPYTWHFPYVDFLVPWTRVFPDRVAVRAFDRTALLNGSVVSDFAAYFASVLNLQFQDVEGIDCGEEANQSISAEGMALLHRFQTAFHHHDPGRFTPDGRRFISALMSASKKLGLERPQLRHEIRDVIVARHKAELMAISENHGVRFSTLDYGELMNKIPSLPPKSWPQDRLSVHDLLENLDRDTGERLQLQCLAELSTWGV